ncbi:hypothetical protein M407DRAFT_20291 [Tulasnella calospora MUT 4182]|uniref:Uncharacterized protein n=1 Tax=Tulasnella calospora MUT 4182 TaxID=1051891 RepID=A0A0C3LA37_9AGAM|nr:hypothetical protein M407DRAFT_20291 [Tulasnella calospora MUT 4182]
MSVREGKLRVEKVACLITILAQLSDPRMRRTWKVAGKLTHKAGHKLREY